MREPVVRGRSQGVLLEQSRLSGGRERLLENRRGAALLVCPQVQLDPAKVLEAEAPTEDRGIGQVLLGLGRQAGGAALDQRAHTGRKQTGGVSHERPHSVDLLDQARLPIRPSELLHDERDSLRLRVHRRRAREVDSPAEDLLDELPGFQLREAFQLQAAHHPHSLHVGDQGHALVDLGKPIRARRESQEDGQVGVGADDVAEHPHAVLVGPLEIVDEHRYGVGGSQRADGDGGEIENSQELVIRRESLECRVVPARDGVENPLELLSRAVAAVLVRGRSSEDRAGEKKRTLDLLVGCRRKRREAFRRRDLRRGDEEPRLADAGLTFESDRRQSSGPGRGELLPDGAELDLPADHRACGPSDLKCMRRCRRPRSDVCFTHASNLREWATTFSCVAKGLCFRRAAPRIRIRCQTRTPGH